MSALVSYRVGGHEYPLTRSSRCRTCRSEHRSQVETLLVGGASFAEAVARLPPEARLSARNVAQHWRRGHLPVEHEVVRRLIEQEGKAAAASVERGVATRIGALVSAAKILEAGVGRLVAGEIEPTMSQTLRAAKLLADYDRAARDERHLHDRIKERDAALASLFATAREHMPPASWSMFLRAVEADDGLRPWLPMAS